MDRYDWRGREPLCSALTSAALRSEIVLANFAHSGAGAPSAAGPKLFSMELKQLDYFLGVAELGSFSKAAIRLSVAQPILSRQIKLLEFELGVELLYRNGRGVVVSEAGKVLETYARSVVGLVEKARSESAP